MDLEKALKTYKEQLEIDLKEEKVLETIRKAEAVFVRYEQDQSLNYLEFMMGQLWLIRKRWWLWQALLLGMTSLTLPYMQDKSSMVRTLGVIGVLFVVLIIPECWKNKSYECMQIEGTCLYSLRQIYAVRIFWFGLVDLFLLTIFCFSVGGNARLTVVEILVQFLFPMLVAACICFGALGSSKCIREGTAIFLCLLWSVIWCIMIMNDAIYTTITLPIWVGFVCLEIVFLAVFVYKTIRDCNKVWEVNLDGITIG